MKAVLNRIVTILFLTIFLAGLLIYFKKQIGPDSDQIMVSNSFIDSLKAIAQLSPDTVMITDTIVISDTIVIMEPYKPIPIYQDQSVTIYKDSIVNSQISVWVRLAVLGEIDSWQWSYKPIYRYQIHYINIPKPYPVKYEVQQPWRGVYGQIGMGYGNYPAMGLEIGYVRSNGQIWASEYIRYGNDNLFMLKAGKRF